MILAYPIVQFSEITPIYRVGIDPFVCGRFYYEYSLADLITEDYPPVYFWYGRDDLTLNLLCWPAAGAGPQQGTGRAWRTLQRSGI